MVSEVLPLSKLDEAFIKHFSYIVDEEHRPVSFFDFVPSFTVDKTEYNISYGTVRNKFSRFKKEKKIEICYRTNQTFFTLPGIRFGTSHRMTIDHTVASRHPIFKIIQNLSFGERAVHDIRLKFTSVGMWDILSKQTGVKVEPFNNDIRVGTVNRQNLFLQVTAHKTDTISIAVACSFFPIIVNVEGIIRLSNALTAVEERLRSIITTSIEKMNEPIIIRIPDHKDWTVTMWHFGRDSISEFSGPKFHCSWEIGQNALIRLYSKTMADGKDHIRLERQEYPQVTIQDCLINKLKAERSIKQVAST